MSEENKQDVAPATEIGSTSPPGDPVTERAIADQVEQRAADLLGEEERIQLDDTFVRQCLDANERGDGVLYATLHRDRFLFNTTPKDGEWLVWKGHVWENDYTRRSFAAVEQCALEYQRAADRIGIRLQTEDLGKEAVDRLTKTQEKFHKRVSRLRTAGGAGKVLTWAPVVDPAMACREDDFDKHPWLLPVRNGVIDLETGALTRGRPADLLTRALDIDYDPRADYAPFATFLDEVSNDPEVSAFLKRSFGCAITGHAFEQYIWVFIGPGRNGKGVLFSMLGNVLGPYYHEINRGFLLEQRNEPSPGAASEHKYSLLGKRLIVGAETNRGQKIDAAAVKSLSGEDKVTCRPNFKSEISFEPTHNLFLHTNHLPVGLAKDFALVQRLLLIEFPFRYVDDVEAEKRKNPRLAETFRQKDPKLKDKLRACRQGILRWLVEGCREWVLHGISPPQSVIDGVSSLQLAEDYIGQFIADCLVHHDDKPDLRLSCTAMYNAFKWWWAQNMDGREQRVPSMKSVNTALRERGAIVEKSGGKTWIYRHTISLDIVEDVEAFIARGEHKS